MGEEQRRRGAAMWRGGVGAAQRAAMSGAVASRAPSGSARRGVDAAGDEEWRTGAESDEERSTVEEDPSSPTSSS